jgi:hypothetical protein
MFDSLRAQLKELDGAKVVVGVQGEHGENFHGQTVSATDDLQKIAWVHEYGIDIDVTPKMRAWCHYNGIHLRADTTKIHIPERSFIRRAHAEGKDDLARLYASLIGKMIQGEVKPDEVLDALGKEAMTLTFSELGVDTKPVSPYTMEHRKASPNPTPLTDTGSLGNHITYRIEKQGGSGSATTFSAGGSG